MGRKANDYSKITLSNNFFISSSRVRDSRKPIAVLTSNEYLMQQDPSIRMGGASDRR